MKQVFLLFLVVSLVISANAQFIPVESSQLYDNFRLQRIIVSENDNVLAVDGLRIDPGGFSEQKGTTNDGHDWSIFNTSILVTGVTISEGIALFTYQSRYCQLLEVKNIQQNSQYIIEHCMGNPYQFVGRPYVHLGKVFATTSHWSGAGDQYITKLRRVSETGDEIVSHFPGVMQLMRFSDAGHGWYIAVNDSLGPCIATQYQTSDSGTSWQRVHDFPPFAQANDAYLRLSAISQTDAYLSCANRLYKTSDGGNHWLALGAYSSNIVDLAFVSLQVGYAVMANALYQTHDGGKNWIWQRPINGPIAYLRGCLLAASGDKAYLVSGDTLYATSRLTGVNDPLVIPTAFSLKQNFPNPFNPSTKISFSLPRTSFVSLIVYDMLGREVRRLIDDVMEAGVHDIAFDGSKLSSGVYFYRIAAGNFHGIKKMILVK